MLEYPDHFQHGTGCALLSKELGDHLLSRKVPDATVSVTATWTIRQIWEMACFLGSYSQGTWLDSGAGYSAFDALCLQQLLLRKFCKALV